MKLKNVNTTVMILLLACILMMSLATTASQAQTAPARPTATPARQVPPAEQASDLVNRARTLMQAGNHAQALTLLERAVGLDAKNENAWILRARAFLETDKNEFAFGTYRRGLQQLPQSVPLWFEFGYAQGRLGRHGEALDSFNKALGLNPNHVNSLKYKGYALMKLYRAEEALTCFKRALELSPDDNHAKLFMGITLFQTGDKENGKQVIREALAAQPNLRSQMSPELVRTLEIQ
jgi:tetratricopeptide (TPR) repeat protein